MSRTYVAHDCRNTRNGSCNNRWVDVDLTHATTLIPTWKYCRECCEKLGIDFEKQKPSDYRSELANQKIKEHVELMHKKKSELRNTPQK